MPASTIIAMDNVGPVLFETSIRARRINITVRPGVGVRVAVPRGISFERAEMLVRTKLDWILRHLTRPKDKDSRNKSRHEGIAVPSTGIDSMEARLLLIKRLGELAQEHGFTFNRVFIRNQKTRWGSCSAKNNINLNLRLVALPQELSNYVILHELVHTRIKNHGPEFWNELERIAVDARGLRRKLRKYRIV